MKYRKAVVLKQEDATTAKTLTIDINLTEVISRFQIKFNSTNDGHDPTAVHATQISKVELVDGSDVLFSMTGKEIEAKMFYDYKCGPSYEREFRNDVDNYLLLDVLFGRYLYDPQLAFDPKRFHNPQLKITHNKALGGSSPDAATIEVFADVFDEKLVSPTGWIMSREYHSFTSAASAAYEYIDLPTDYIIKRIMLQTSKADSWWENLVSEVKISEDNDKRVPLHLDGADLVSLVMDMYGPYRELLACTMSGAGPVTFYITPTETAYFAIGTIGTDATTFVGPDAECVGGYQTLVSDGARGFKAQVAGYIPHGCVPIDFGNPMDMEDWYDVTAKGSVRLIPKASGEVAFNTILEQLRRY
jgi:hypothetical protein